jgi:phenylacetate-CoA ligase
VQYAYDAVPYYREVMRGRSLHPEDIRHAADLSKLPVVSKMEVRAEPQAFQSRLVPLDKCVLLKSTRGGASYWDPDSAFRRMAFLERDRVVWTRLARLRPGHTRLVIVPETSSVHTQRTFLNTKVLVPRLWAQRVPHDAALPFSTLVEKLERLRPEVAFSYGSYLEHFFRFLRNGGIQPAFLPRLWSFSSDAVDPGWREIIEREYGVLVYSTYAATEMGRIGYECERRGAYHLNIDTLAVRVIDAEGGDVPPGETGELCISNLLNRGTVLLNYRMDDFGSIASARCECGRNLPVLGAFYGKVSGVVKLGDGREVLSPIFLRLFLDELAPTLKYQLVIDGVGSVTFRVVLARGTSAQEVSRGITRKVREEFGGNLQVTVEPMESGYGASGGKFPRVLSKDSRS